MKTYPKLEQFLNNLAFCAVTEPWILDLCEAAGVDWSWPKTFAGDVVQEFKTAAASVGTGRAFDQVRPSLRMLETTVNNLAKLPIDDLEALRAEYRELSQVQASVDLANAILKEPENHERILARRPEFGSKAVATIDYEGLRKQIAIELKDIRERGAKVIIPAYPNLSELIGGFNPGRLTLLLARSGGGKSISAMCIAIAATDVMAVGYMNLEMGYSDTARRVAVKLSGKKWADLYANRLVLEDTPETLPNEFRMSDGSELSVEAIISWARAFKRTNPKFGLLVIDYDQKLQVEASRDTPEWKALHLAIRELEDLAKKIGIHVMLLAQFNRQGELASSHRMINTAHTVLKFREHDGGMIIENSIKCRWAKYPRALRVNYQASGARVTESPLEQIFDLVEDSPAPVSKELRNKYSKPPRGAWNVDD